MREDVTNVTSSLIGRHLAKTENGPWLSGRGGDTLYDAIA